MLAAHAVRISGDVQLQRLNATGGQLNLRGAELGSSLDLEQATLTSTEPHFGCTKQLSTVRFASSTAFTPMAKSSSPAQ